MSPTRGRTIEWCARDGMDGKVATWLRRRCATGTGTGCHRSGRAILLAASDAPIALPRLAPRAVVRETTRQRGPVRTDRSSRRSVPHMTTEQVAASINPWQVAQQQFDLAAERLNLDPGLRRVLREP